jgi:acetyl-CoA carboxylase biotin carboxyl carrier protein
MNEKKWRLVDDDVIVGLINNFEAKQWLNGVMEEGMCASSKAIAGVSPVIEHSIPCLTWLTKLLYLKRFSLNQELALDSKDIKEIKSIIDLMKKHDLSVFEIEKEGFRLKLQRGASVPQATIVAPAGAAASAKAPVAGAEPPAPTAKAIESVPMKEIVSPMVGTFYRAASPDGPPFVEVGKPVTEETVVCIIEAMKVMNEIKAETSGVIAEVLAENGKPVQFGQALFKVR